MAIRAPYTDNSNVTSHLATTVNEPGNLTNLAGVITSQIWETLERDGTRHGFGRFVNGYTDAADMEDEEMWSEIYSLTQELLEKVVTSARNRLS